MIVVLFQALANTPAVLAIPPLLSCRVFAVRALFCFVCFFFPFMLCFETLLCDCETGSRAAAVVDFLPRSVVCDNSTNWFALVCAVIYPFSRLALFHENSPFHRQSGGKAKYTCVKYTHSLSIRRIPLCPDLPALHLESRFSPRTFAAHLLGRVASGRASERAHTHTHTVSSVSLPSHESHEEPRASDR